MQFNISSVITVRGRCFSVETTISSDSGTWEFQLVHLSPSPKFERWEDYLQL